VVEMIRESNSRSKICEFESTLRTSVVRRALTPLFVTPQNTVWTRAFVIRNFQLFLSASFLEKRGSLRDGIQLLKKARKVEPDNVQVLSFLSSLHR